MLDFELRGDPGDLKVCLQDVIEVIRTARLTEEVAAYCTEQLAKPWKPGDTLQTPPWRISLYHEPRWAAEAWAAEVPPGTSVTIVGEPTCALIPSLPGREHNFDLVWPVHVAGYPEVVWVFQADLEQGLPRPPADGTEALFALPLPYRPGPGLPGTTFAPGVRGKVCTQDAPLRLRAEPGLRGRVLALIPPDTLFTVIDGPVFRDGWLWWRVRLDDGREGWFMEGEEKDETGLGMIPCPPYYICPYLGEP
ncbi:MAG: SH3 domain-containing protein [Chloroflexi bacterium]|nr:SH3 domain-containing protein [Chloroflexota bacterium]